MFCGYVFVIDFRRCFQARHLKTTETGQCITCMHLKRFKCHLASSSIILSPWILDASITMPQFQAGTGVPAQSEKSSEHVKKGLSEMKIRDRRRKYLDTHPEYLNDPELELAGLFLLSVALTRDTDAVAYPLLWERLIRRFQSPAERDVESKRKGFSGILEADILRGEAKTEALRHPDPDSLFTYRRGPDGEILAEERGEVPVDKSDGRHRWRLAMETRFVRGADIDFDYEEVDNSEVYDDHTVEELEEVEKYFNAEEPEFVKRTNSSELQGETGIQDF